MIGLNNLSGLDGLDGLKYINENGEVQSYSKITSESKKKRMIAAIATRIAKRKHDPLFNKSLAFKKKWQILTQKIQRKYQAQATQEYAKMKR